MSTNGCSKCEDVRMTVPIKSASEMTNVLKVIRDNLADGTLVEAAYWPPGKLKIGRPAFTSIPTSGPWPDYLEYYFSCASCGQLYRLSVEAYHGMGGAWSTCERAA